MGVNCMASEGALLNRPPLLTIKTESLAPLSRQEKKRDYAVIETCLIDLTDPKSPANKNSVKNGRVGKYIVLGPKTSRSDGCLSREDLPSLMEGADEGQKIPEEIGDELRQRFRRRSRWRTFVVQRPSFEFAIPT